jgi:hypothetical protein
MTRASSDGSGPPGQPLRQVLPHCQLHRQEADPFRLVQSVDHGDVGMIERGEELRFPVKPRQSLGVLGEDIREDLDGDRSVERRIGRFPDHPHPALADLFHETVMGKHPAGLKGQAEVSSSYPSSRSPPRNIDCPAREVWKP